MCHPFLLFPLDVLTSFKHKATSQASARLQPGLSQVHQAGQRGHQEPGRDFLGGQLQTLEVDGLKAFCFQQETQGTKETKCERDRYGKKRKKNSLYAGTNFLTVRVRATGLQGALLPAVRYSRLSGRV